MLFLHGGNALGQGHWALVDPYVDAGYVVMIPSMRGENGQKGNFSGFYDEVDDVLSASDRLRHLPGVDPHRMFLAGHSVGGTLAMLAAMSARRFRAATPISGNPDAFAFFNRYPQDIRFDDKNPREFQMRSPVCYAHSFKCPMKLMHGSEEVHFTTCARALGKAGNGRRREDGGNSHAGRAYHGSARRDRTEHRVFQERGRLKRQKLPRAFGGSGTAFTGRSA